MTPPRVAPRLVLDRSVRTFRGGTVLVGGHPGRLITLNADGVNALSLLLEGRPSTDAARSLGQRLVRTGMAHPTANTNGRPSDIGRQVTVVVPVRDRSRSLDRCLASLGGHQPVVVVDDGSDDPAAVAEVCERRGAHVIRRHVNGGPGAARNEGMALVRSELVAFVDSDCTVGEGWLDGLVWMFEDPGVGAVAPRVRPEWTGSRSARSRFSEDHSSLDMGPEPSEVGPDRVVRYVPTTALVMRTSAWDKGFDTDLRVGEDVDLVWRLLDAGWRIRYQPAVTVRHREPSSWASLMARRFRYGTSAGPLARRHPDRLAPLELRPWPTAAVVALLGGTPALGLAMIVASATAIARRVHRHGIPFVLTLRWSAEGAGWTMVGVGRAATMLVAPALVVTAVRSKRTAAALAFLVILPPTVEWWQRRPRLDPVRWSLASIADNVAYGAGVWSGCLRAGTLAPLLPSLLFARTSE